MQFTHAEIMENKEKGLHTDENDLNIQPSAAKSAEDTINEIENESAENVPNDQKRSYEELEEKAEGLLEKIGFGKKKSIKKKHRS